MKSVFQAVLVVAAIFGIGCGAGQSTLNLDGHESALCSQGLLGQAIDSTGPVPEGCVKIEGSDIGRAPQTLEVGGVTVTITGWQNKEGSSGEYIGFTYTEAGGSVIFAVKASTRTFAGSDTTWVHPDGTSGPRANGISNITFCVDEEDGSTPGTDGGQPNEVPGGGTPDGGQPNEVPGGGSTDGGQPNEVPGGGSSDAGTVTEVPGGGECGNPNNGNDDITEGPGGPGSAADAGTPQVYEPAGPGSPCNLNEQCLSNVCTEGVCEQSPGGGACNVATDCPQNYLCQESVCVPDIQ